MSSVPKPTGLVSHDRVIGVQFGMLNPRDTEKRSVVEVRSASTYDGNSTVPEGLFDPRMGVLDNNVVCPTDGQTNISCPGYFGHYKTCMPVYNIGYLDTIRKLLTCVCVRCGKMYVDPNSPEGEMIKNMPVRARFGEVYSLSSRASACGSMSGDGCGAPRPRTILKEGVANLIAEYVVQNEEGGEDSGKTSKVRRPLPVQLVKEILSKITDDDLSFMGFDPRWSRPEWAVTDVIPVPPPYIRPSVKFDNNQRSEDDITYIYSNIIKADQTLRTRIRNEADADIIQDWWNWCGQDGFVFTLGSNSTLSNPAAGGTTCVGKSFTVVAVQNGTGGYTFTFGTQFKKTDGSNIGTVAAGTANQRMIAMFTWDGTYFWAQNTPTFVS